MTGTPAGVTSSVTSSNTSQGAADDRLQQPSPPGQGDPQPVDRAVGRNQVVGEDLAARRRRPGPGAGHPRVQPVSKGGRDRHPGRHHASLLCRSRLRGGARRSPRQRPLGRHPRGRVPATRAGRRPGGAALAGGAALVHRRHRDDRRVLGWVQRAPGCRAPSSGAEGHHQRLLHGRPLRGRRPLHGWLRPGVGHAAMGEHDARVQRPPAGPDDRRRRLAFAVAGPTRAHAPVHPRLAGAPTARWLLEAGLRL